MIRGPRRSIRTATLFPNTTLSRSDRRYRVRIDERAQADRFQRAHLPHFGDPDNQRRDEQRDDQHEEQAPEYLPQRPRYIGGDRFNPRRARRAIMNRKPDDETGEEADEIGRAHV